MPGDPIPRRSQIDKMTTAELSILSSMRAVEVAGADTRLTEAVVLLQKARDKVADFVDGVESPPEHRGIACEDRCGTRLETWWCAACNAKHGRPPQYAREVEKIVATRDAALARIKSLEDGIVAENKRTNLLVNELQTDVKHYNVARAEKAENELQAAKDALLARSEIHQSGKANIAIAVERILNERDDAKEKCAEQLERIKGLEHDTVVLNEARTREASVPEPEGTSPVLGDTGAIRSFLIEQGEYSRFSGLSVFVSVARILHERNTERRDLSSIRDMLADTADNPVEEHKRLRAPNETAAAVSALLSHSKGQENSLEAQSKALDASEERASTATDILCMALGKDHGRGGLVEHCQKAAEKIRTLSCYSLSAKFVDLEADQRATGDVLAGILGRERCEDRNVCLANEVSAWVERLQVLMHNLNQDFARYGVVVEAARKVCSLQGRWYTLAARELEPALRALDKDSGGTGAAQADVDQRCSSCRGSGIAKFVNEGCRDCGGTGRSATSSRPWLCKTCGGDTRYVGNKRGCKCKVEFKRWQHFNDTTAALSGGNQHPNRCVCQGDEPTPHKHYDDEPHACARCSCRAYQALLVLPESVRREAYPPPKPTDPVSREQLIAACRSAALWELSNTGVQSAFKALIRALEKP